MASRPIGELPNDQAEVMVAKLRARLSRRALSYHPSVTSVPVIRPGPSAHTRSESDGLPMVAVEWTLTQGWHGSLELFARCVIPQFKGTLRGMQNSYLRTIDNNRLGKLPVARSGVLRVDGSQTAGQ